MKYKHGVTQVLEQQNTFPEFDDVMFLLERGRGRYWQKK